MMLLVVGACFGGAFWWLAKLIPSRRWTSRSPPTHWPAPVDGAALAEALG